MPFGDAFKDPVIVATMTNLPSGTQQPPLNITGCSWQVSLLLNDLFFMTYKHVAHSFMNAHSHSPPP
jgi:hypothetical protein